MIEPASHFNPKYFARSASAVTPGIVPGERSNRAQPRGRGPRLAVSKSNHPTSLPRLSRALTVCLAVLLADVWLPNVLLSHVVLAQQPFALVGQEETIPPAPTLAGRRPATIEAVRLGWRGHLFADCWGPARVYISGNPLINNGAFGGTLEVLYAQDGSQSAQIRVPVATTPGRVTPVEVTLALPAYANQLTLTLYDDSGRVVHGRIYRRGDNPIPATILSATPIVLAVADRGGVQSTILKAFSEPGLGSAGALSSANRMGRPSPTRNPLDDLACIGINADELPETWAAYDGVTAVVIGADEIAALPSARMAALLDWVHAGGCVIARTGNNNTGLAKLFERSPARVDWQAPRPVAPGEELEHIFAEPTKFEKNGSRAEARATLHSSVQAATFTLVQPQDADPDLAAWRVRWSPREATSNGGVQTRGLLSEGPMGFGWVVVMGIDPPMLGVGADDAAGRVAWRDVLRSCASELATRARSTDEFNWGSRGSGADHSARTALRSALNHLSDVPALGDGAFIVIVLCLLALAAAVGPFDALFLGHKKKRQISWATALVWIAVASVLAAALPPLLRGGDSRLRRLRVIDAITGPDAALTPAWQSAVTTLFAGVGGPTRLTPADANMHDAGWFRGVSPLFVQPLNSTDPLVRFATVQQHPPGDAPVSGRSNRLDQQSPLRMGQWTFRTFLEQGPTAVPSITLERAEADSSDSWLVHFPPALGTFVDGALRIGDSWSALQVDRADPTRTTLRVGGRHVWNIRDEISQIEYRDLSFHSGLALELAGTRERSRALHARLASGEWGVVYLRLMDTPATLSAHRVTWAGADEPFNAREETVYRLLVPLGEFRVPRRAWNVTLPQTIVPEEAIIPGLPPANLPPPPIHPTPPDAPSHATPEANDTTPATPPPADPPEQEPKP